LAAATSSAIAQNPAATVRVDAHANRKLISPLIYGANWAEQSALVDWAAQVGPNRQGPAASSVNINDGAWHHIAASIAGSTRIAAPF
jgi:hypothetical protein